MEEAFGESIDMFRKDTYMVILTAEILKNHRKDASRKTSTKESLSAG